MAHLRPLNDDEIDDAAIVERFRHYERTRGFTPNSIRTMARRPGIVRAFMELNQQVLYEGTVDTETKMLVSLASSLSAGCRYCQSHMTNLSSIYQASDEKIAALLDYQHSDQFTPAERAAIAIGFKAGQSPNGVEEADFDQLREHYDDGQIVEIVASAALFGYLNRWNDTVATTLEQLPAEVTERAWSDPAWDRGKHT